MEKRAERTCRHQALTRLLLSLFHPPPFLFFLLTSVCQAREWMGQLSSGARFSHAGDSSSNPDVLLRTLPQVEIYLRGEVISFNQLH